jgi:hypothetical protein
MLEQILMTAVGAAIISVVSLLPGTRALRSVLSKSIRKASIEFAARNATGR